MFGAWMDSSRYLVVTAITLLPVVVQARTCLIGSAAEHDADAAEVQATLDAIDAGCPCASYAPGEREPYRACLKPIIDDRVRTLALRGDCKGTVRRIVRASVASGQQCTPNPSFMCPPITYPMTAVR